MTDLDPGRPIQGTHHLFPNSKVSAWSERSYTHICADTVPTPARDLYPSLMDVNSLEAEAKPWATGNTRETSKPGKGARRACETTATGEAEPAERKLSCCYRESLNVEFTLFHLILFAAVRSARGRCIQHSEPYPVCNPGWKKEDILYLSRAETIWSGSLTKSSSSAVLNESGGGSRLVVAATALEGKGS